MTEQDFRPPRRQHSALGWWWVLLALLVVGLGGWYGKAYWDAQQAPASPPTSPVVVPPAVPAPTPEAVEPEPDVAAEPPAAEVPAQPLHPLPAAEALGSTAIEVPSLDRWAIEWLGKPALQFLVTPGLAHHVVATIDNLPRGQAASRLWPLSPVGGKILLEEGPQGLQIAPGNSARYDALVGFVTGIDPAQAAAWYRQAYPLLQQSYEELGYPGKYFNDRLVEVIDHLLQTPEPAASPAVDLVQVHGQIAPQQPWLRYEFADEALEQRSAGQKILLRLGPEHRQRIKTYLQALRAHIATP